MNYSFKTSPTPSIPHPQLINAAHLVSRSPLPPGLPPQSPSLPQAIYHPGVLSPHFLPPTASPFYPPLLPQPHLPHQHLHPNTQPPPQTTTSNPDQSSSSSSPFLTPRSLDRGDSESTKSSSPTQKKRKRDIQGGVISRPSHPFRAIITTPPPPPNSISSSSSRNPPTFTRDSMIYSPCFHCFTTLRFYAQLCHEMSEIATQLDQSRNEKARACVWNYFYWITGERKTISTNSLIKPMINQWLAAESIDITMIEYLYLAILCIPKEIL